MSRSVFGSVAFVACVTLGLSLSTARDWQSADGKYTVDAEFVESDGTNVRLQVKNGAVIAVPLAKLSAADQAYVAEQAQPSAGTDSPAEPAGATAGMSEEQLKAELEELGLRVGSISLSHDDETKLTSHFTELEKSRRQLFKASRDLSTAEQRLAQIRQAQIRLQQINVQLNGRLTTINPTDFAENNRLVGAINANQSQMNLYQQQEMQMEEALRKTRADTNKVKEAYVEEILALRGLADEIIAKFEQLSANPKAKALVAQLNTSTGRDYAFESRTFESSLRKLRAVEDTVLSETIKLRREPSGTQYVSVVLDGKHSFEMVLDSGASLISLPERIAREAGIEITSASPTITLELADGRRIPGKLVTIPSVRVGKFIVENVEAAVLGPEAIRAEPLLGMSFLENFKFEIDAQENTLKMVKVETGK